MQVLEKAAKEELSSQVFALESIGSISSADAASVKGEPLSLSDSFD